MDREQVREFAGIVPKKVENVRQYFIRQASIPKTIVKKMDAATKDFSSLQVKSLLGEERFRVLIEQSTDIIAIFDAQATILFISPSITEILGYQVEELLQQEPFQFVHPDDVAEAKIAFGRVLGKPNEVDRTEFRVRHKNGTDRILECRTRNLLGHPAIGGLVLNCRDVTEQKQIESLYLRSQRLESIGRLAEGVARDFNNLLTPIFLALQLLREPRPDRDRLELLDTAGSAAERARDLVKQLLAFANSPRPEPQRIGPKLLLEEVCRLLLHTLPRNIELHSEISDALWPVRGDFNQLMQVFLNLGINARDAMASGGVLRFVGTNCEIAAHEAARTPKLRPGAHVRIQVRDAGAGIAPEHRSKIFDPFFTTKSQGSGLGLWTVLGIVDRHAGDIHVESEVGRGTTVSIYLPACP